MKALAVRLVSRPHGVLGGAMLAADSVPLTDPTRPVPRVRAAVTVTKPLHVDDGAHLVPGIVAPDPAVGILLSPREDHDAEA